jgi:hypothetical protein
MEKKLPPPADISVVKLELIRIKMILENPNNLRIAGERKKNMETLTRLGITLAGCITYINELTYKNYLSGPSDDRDTKEEKCIWEFGTTIQGHDIYIKIKHLVEDNVLLLSFHEAEKPFVFRYS